MGGGSEFCGSQCGEVYRNEWFSDPPACCDPCDHCGNYTGGGHHHGPSYGPGEYYGPDQGPHYGHGMSQGDEYAPSDMPPPRSGRSRAPSSVAPPSGPPKPEPKSVIPPQRSTQKRRSRTAANEAHRYPTRQSSNLERTPSRQAPSAYSARGRTKAQQNVYRSQDVYGDSRFSAKHGTVTRPRVSPADYAPVYRSADNGQRSVQRRPAVSSARADGTYDKDAPNPYAVARPRIVRDPDSGEILPSRGMRVGDGFVVDATVSEGRPAE